MTYRIHRYHYTRMMEEPHDITVNPTNLTTDSETDAIEMCELMQKVYDMGNTRSHHEWFKFGYETK